MERAVVSDADDNKTSCSAVEAEPTDNLEKKICKEEVSLQKKVLAIKDSIERIVLKVSLPSVVHLMLTDLVIVLSIVTKTSFWLIVKMFYKMIAIPKKSAGNYFENERVLILGGSSEVGREIALQFARYNINHITLWDTDTVRLKEVADEIKYLKSSSRVFIYTLPCFSKESVQDTIAKMKFEAGDVSLLVNAIDISTNTNKKILTADTNSLLDIIQQEITMYTLAVKAFLPMMLELRHGCIAFVVPPQIFSSKARQSLYCTSKAALYSYSKVLRTELAEGGYGGVKVACICPWRNVASSKVIARIVVETATNNNSFVVIPSMMSLVHPVIWMLPSRLQLALIRALTAKENC